MSLQEDGIVTGAEKPAEAKKETPEGEKNLSQEKAQDSESENKDGSSPAEEFPPSLQERFLRIKKMVKEAIEAHHTFMIYGKSKVIRECLLARGWCEKFYGKPSNGDRASGNVNTSPVVLLAGIGDLKDHQSERMLVSRMLADCTVDFLWNSGSEWAGWPARDNKTTLFNRYCRAGFTSKVGLCSNVRQMHWYYEADVANTLFPRCYNVCQADQMHAFVEDFRFTACLSLLKWLVDTINTEGENATRSPTGTIPLKALDFAIRRCTDYIGAQSHEDIDRDVERVWSHQWDQFITWYYKIVQGQAVFVRNNVPFNKYFLASRHILKKIRRYWQQLDMDGILNIWILKPGNKSRGRGIVLINKLEDVVARVNPANKTDTRYVVQKYIEKPMLIYGTKFDIRQWFIVTCAQPLTIWMYRESYLRFCSQKFRLGDFHESVHLCNNAVQCKYKNSPDRDPALPVDNMWDATTFKQFLKAEGHDEAWDQLIYPGMKQGLVGSLLASQEAMDRRKNSFELYGADFMVMEDFSVWLIEINSHPDMSYSSSVTTRLCRQVMEDTIKVVIDFREDKNANTGLFELAYRQRMPNCQPYLGAALSLHGTRITACEKKSNLGGPDSRINLPTRSPTVSLGRSPSTAHSYIGPVIVDLIEELELQLDREFVACSKLETPRSRQSSAKLCPGPVKSPENESKDEKPPEALPPPSPSAPAPPTIATTKNKSRTSGSSLAKATKNWPRGISTRNKHGTSAKPDVGSTRRNIISRVMELGTSESARPKNVERSARKINGEKTIDTAMREAVKKYKKYGAGSPEVPPIPTLPVTARSSIARAVRASTTNGKPTRTRRGRTSQEKRSSLLEDPNDIYAVGLGLTK